MQFCEGGEDEKGEEMFDLVCYEGKESLNWEGERRRGDERVTFSPIEERDAEQEVTIQKNPPKQVENSLTLLLNPQKKLFTYSHPKLPRLKSHKKYNYLEQINEHKH